jgi:hypothetical protein
LKYRTPIEVEVHYASIKNPPHREGVTLH